MKNVNENPLYLEDVQYVASLNLPWNQMEGKTIFLTGATGMIGSFLVDVLLRKRKEGLRCGISALCRNPEKAQERFPEFDGCDSELRLLRGDIVHPVESETGKADWVLHLASNTHPMEYSTDPIGTIMTNVEGLKNVLDYAVQSHSQRVVFASSNEVYGENRGDIELFPENYCGYLDCNTLRAGYPESKRCGEALCQAYRKAKGLDIVIPRFTRTYGPTMNMDDTKAISQFIKNAIKGKDIVLKSQGHQFYSYTYVADAVTGLLYILLKGIDGEAYNIADEMSDIMLRDLAAMIAGKAGTEIRYEFPDLEEAKGYSKATKARLSSEKLKRLGWTANYDIESGLERSLTILKWGIDKSMGAG